MAEHGNSGRFPLVMRGYDPKVVDRVVAEFEARLADIEDQADQADQSASNYPQRGEFGASVERLLMAAEAEAHQLLSSAQEQSTRLLFDSQMEAELCTSQAERTAAELTARVRSEAEELARATRARADELLQAAKREALESVETAKHEAEELSLASEQKIRERELTHARTIASDRAALDRELIEARAVAEREIDEMRISEQKRQSEVARVLTERQEAAELTLNRQFQEAQALSENLVRSAQERVADMESKALEALEEAEHARTSALQESDALMFATRRDVAILGDQIDAHAQATVAEARAEAERIRQTAAKEVAVLAQQRDEIVAQLEALRGTFGLIDNEPLRGAPAPGSEQVELADHGGARHIELVAHAEAPLDTPLDEQPGMATFAPEELTAIDAHPPIPAAPIPAAPIPAAPAAAIEHVGDSENDRRDFPDADLERAWGSGILSMDEFDNILSGGTHNPREIFADHEFMPEPPAPAPVDSIPSPEFLAEEREPVGDFRTRGEQPLPPWMGVTDDSGSTDTVEMTPFDASLGSIDDDLPGDMHFPFPHPDENAERR